MRTSSRRSSSTPSRSKSPRRSGATSSRRRRLGAHDRVVSGLRGDGFAESILWVFEDNPRTRRFCELVGWVADGGAKDEHLFGATAPAIRYRLTLEPPAQ